jgi:hypothetical protein
MSETNDTPATTEATPTTRKGRPAGKSNKKERRNFAGELQDLQTKVDLTGKLLVRLIENDPTGKHDLLRAALDVLEVPQKLV